MLRGAKLVHLARSVRFRQALGSLYSRQRKPARDLAAA
jgi:hypothetical protein